MIPIKIYENRLPSGKTFWRTWRLPMSPICEFSLSKVITYCWKNMSPRRISGTVLIVPKLMEQYWASSLLMYCYGWILT